MKRIAIFVCNYKNISTFAHRFIRVALREWLFLKFHNDPILSILRANVIMTDKL